jgi:hypothetical protein
MSEWPTIPPKLSDMPLSAHRALSVKVTPNGQLPVAPGLQQQVSRTPFQDPYADAKTKNFGYLLCIAGSRESDEAQSVRTRVSSGRSPHVGQLDWNIYARRLGRPLSCGCGGKILWRPSTHISLELLATSL